MNKETAKTKLVKHMAIRSAAADNTETILGLAVTTTRMCGAKVLSTCTGQLQQTTALQTAFSLRFSG
jgi:hypothetical protein